MYFFVLLESVISFQIILAQVQTAQNFPNFSKEPNGLQNLLRASRQAISPFNINSNLNNGPSSNSRILSNVPNGYGSNARLRWQPDLSNIIQPNNIVTQNNNAANQNVANSVLNSLGNGLQNCNNNPNNIPVNSIQGANTNLLNNIPYGTPNLMLNNANTMANVLPYSNGMPNVGSYLGSNWPIQSPAANIVNNQNIMSNGNLINNDVPSFSYKYIPIEDIYKSNNADLANNINSIFGVNNGLPIHNANRINTVNSAQNFNNLLNNEIASFENIIYNNAVSDKLSVKNAVIDNLPVMNNDLNYVNNQNYPLINSCNNNGLNTVVPYNNNNNNLADVKTIQALGNILNDISIANSELTGINTCLKNIANNWQPANSLPNYISANELAPSNLLSNGLPLVANTFGFQSMPTLNYLGSNLQFNNLPNVNGLPIINGLPVIGITETVSFLNSPYVL